MNDSCEGMNFTHLT